MGNQPTPRALLPTADRDPTVSRCAGDPRDLGGRGLEATLILKKCGLPLFWAEAALLVIDHRFHGRVAAYRPQQRSRFPGVQAENRVNGCRTLGLWRSPHCGRLFSRGAPLLSNLHPIQRINSGGVVRPQLSPMGASHPRVPMLLEEVLTVPLCFMKTISVFSDAKQNMSLE